MHKLDGKGFVIRNPQKMSNDRKKQRNGSLIKIKASSFPSNDHNTWLGLHLRLVTHIRITYVIKLQ
ncbi:hypothetical protein Hanom_Chr04g00326001 [Helianthus anomalus]